MAIINRFTTGVGEVLKDTSIVTLNKPKEVNFQNGNFVQFGENEMYTSTAFTGSITGLTNNRFLLVDTFGALKLMEAGENDFTEISSVKIPTDGWVWMVAKLTDNMFVVNSEIKYNDNCNFMIYKLEANNTFKQCYKWLMNRFYGNGCVLDNGLLVLIDTSYSKVMINKFNLTNYTLVQQKEITITGMTDIIGYENYGNKIVIISRNKIQALSIDENLNVETGNIYSFANNTTGNGIVTKFKDKLIYSSLIDDSSYGTNMGKMFIFKFAELDVTEIYIRESIPIVKPMYRGISISENLMLFNNEYIIGSNNNSEIRFCLSSMLVKSFVSLANVGMNKIVADYKDKATRLLSCFSIGNLIKTKEITFGIVKKINSSSIDVII